MECHVDHRSALHASPLILGAGDTFRTSRLPSCGPPWMVGYVSFGTVQRERAEDAGLALAIARGHQITDISAKPGFASLLL